MTTEVRSYIIFIPTRTIHFVRVPSGCKFESRTVLWLGQSWGIDSNCEACEVRVTWVAARRTLSYWKVPNLKDWQNRYNFFFHVMMQDDSHYVTLRMVYVDHFDTLAGSTFPEIRVLPVPRSGLIFKKYWNDIVKCYWGRRWILYELC